MGNTYGAHIFKRASVGEREEVTIKLFKPDGTPLDLEGGTGPDDPGVPSSSDLLYEKFNGDLSAYVPNHIIDPSSSLVGLEVSDGSLHVTDGNEHAFHHPDISYKNGTQIIKIYPLAASTIGIIKYISDTVYILLHYAQVSSVLQLYYNMGAGGVAIGSGMALPTVAQVPIYLALSVDGSNVFGASYLLDPRSGATPFSSASARIPSEAESALSVAGHPGVRFISGGAPREGQRMDEWRVFEFSSDEETSDV